MTTPVAPLLPPPTVVTVETTAPAAPTVVAVTQTPITVSVVPVDAANAPSSVSVLNQPTLVSVVAVQEKGLQGDPGVNGRDGTNGLPGQDGSPGLPGAAGTAASTFALVAQAIPAFHVVAINALGNAYLPSASVPADAFRVIGISVTAANLGEQVEIRPAGRMTTSPSWSVGPLFLGLGGQLTSVPPTLGFQVQVAVAISVSELLVRPQFPIFI